MIGKRKRTTVTASQVIEDAEDRSNPPSQNDDGQDIFRKYFEATFEPLPQKEASPPLQDREEDDESNAAASGSESESEWSGISENEADVTAVQIVDHQITSDHIDKLFDQTAARKFMVIHDFFLKTT